MWSFCKLHIKSLACHLSFYNLQSLKSDRNDSHIWASYKLFPDNWLIPRKYLAWSSSIVERTKVIVETTTMNKLKNATNWANLLVQGYSKVFHTHDLSAKSCHLSGNRQKLYIIPPLSETTTSKILFIS